MSKRKEKPRAPSYASTEPTRDNFGRLYVSMARSGTFRALHPLAQYVYAICTIQAASSDGRRALYEYADAEGVRFREGCFVFPRTHMKMYGVAPSTIQKYLPELERAGFIETVEQNKHRRKMNVYAFSDKWKDSG